MILPYRMWRHPMRLRPLMALKRILILPYSRYRNLINMGAIFLRKIGRLAWVGIT